MSRYYEEGIYIQNDIAATCLLCRCNFYISTDDIECEKDTEDGPDGIRIMYRFIAKLSCPKCGKMVIYSQEIFEYPIGIIEKIYEPKCSGAEIQSTPEIRTAKYSNKIITSGRILFDEQFATERDILKLDIIDGNANIENKIILPNHSQRIWINPAGKLLPILVHETGTIHFDDNKATFSKNLQANPQMGAMQLLGKVAEAVIVRRCHDYSLLNKTWLAKARKNRTLQKTADGFIAIGTGLHSTKREYPHKYNPSDSQRDIVWINEDEEYALVADNGFTSGIPAGLQIKVSGNGLNYILKTLINNKYEVPLVYFPIHNDFDAVLERANRVIPIEPGIDFIDVRTIDEDAYFEIKDYYQILFDLYSDRMTVDDFIMMASGSVPMQNSIIASALMNPNTDVKIIY